ncbi:hypothetical protein RhiirA5_373317 [Rhizophagus irregularis]|uniref:C2H2-type domain-containing protein n=3 Tax=Rhizophagus irregularis TaxID=588596 RepID=A0A2I1E1P2_9GLOM|nr:hypothetical protein GLOIN_2v1883032 [Rhizophagus irregularis DAOM 181602=DAOM 197198]EXX63980.1 hypothetical protein RirG_147160 [Rhizophagus irregularis DAOM 197198w]PKC03374.1 hypothetical protein RhiirA5_423870 [Rhizophagus irregularis]PKC12141.1 hypothetical protein RhiirA5_373317 [Rhizophagus irregularis]PKY16054.1 hypothetical protein RhiirB3_479757 [Rhizophagus irregularis]POG62224.1 hypothetical protein GLOIN_2v1883032 [Rhizophagus irregularis DAOM 181602=DAOM 197198]|eukprot:XP_025169090.1 hypothetical protein GLOIN_2v1883032 [Rhizophagus irregularis DAOM 181602=DAOM 197198]
MSESINPKPFVCKWLYPHSKPQYFKTVDELRKHVAKHDINSCNKSLSVYICPWEGCKKSYNKDILLEEHLRKHIQQRPFKCPICSYTRFVTLVALSQHLINNHKDSFVDFTGDDEIEKLNSEKDGGEVDIFVKEKINRDDANTLVDGKIKYEVSPASHTAKLSYRDVLVKGSVNKNAANTSSINYEEGWKLYFEAAEAISVLMEKRFEEIDDDYDYDSDNYDNVPEAPKGHLTEKEEDKLFWETICDVYKGTEAVTMMRKAREMLGMPI